MGIQQLLLAQAAAAVGGGGGAVLDGLGFSGAWSPSRLLLSAYGGAKETDSGGAYDSWLDQTGNSRTLTMTSTARPAVATGGPNARACGDFDGSNDYLPAAGIPISFFISASAGYGIVSFIADTISATATDTTNPYNNVPVWGDSNGYAGVYLRSPNIVQGLNYDAGGSDKVESTITLGATCVVEWWHEAGQQYVCVNNGTPVNVASGDTQVLTNALGLGRGYLASNRYFDGKIFEFAMAPSKPATRSAIAADFMTWVGAGVGAHRYWRINATANNSGGSNTISGATEIQMFTGSNGFGSDVCNGGTVSADSEYDTPAHAAEGAFDGDQVDAATNVWASQTGAFPHWIKYDLGAGNDKAVFGISILGGLAANTRLQAPRDFSVQYSDDNSTWNTYWSQTGINYAVDYEMKWFRSPDVASYTGSPHGSHRYWRLLPIEDDGGGIVAASEIQFRSTPGGSNIATSGAAASDSGHFSTWTAALAFDGNNTTNYASTGGTYSTSTVWLAYDFGSPVAVAEITWRNRADSAANQAPKTMAVQFADVSTGPWTTAWMVTGQTGWALGQTRTFTDPNYNGIGDPFWANVTFMVSGIGTNGATAIPDLSIVACGNPAITGAPTISTSSPITGFSSSILTSGASGAATDYLKWGNGTIPPSLDTPSTLNAVWTVEMVWKPSAAGTVFAWGGDWTGVGTYGGFVQNLTGGSFRCYNGTSAGVGGFDFSSAASAWASGTEYFLVLESNGTKMRLYLGTLASGTCTMIASTTSVTGSDSRDLVGGYFRLGYYGFAGQSAGRWNWVRVTKGIARYNSDSGLTIPSFPLPNH